MEHINYALVPKTHTSMYLMHKYWARKPHNIVAEYIEHYSKKDDIVLDPFSGSGVTAIEAIKRKRKAIAIDLDPMAIFIATETATPVDIDVFKKEYEIIEKQIRTNINSLYKTTCLRCKNETTADATIWEKDNPIEIRYGCSCSKKSQWKKVSKSDLKFINHISKKSIPCWYPKNELIWNSRINVKRGERVCDLFTHRNLLALSMILEEIERIKNKRIRSLMKFTFSSALSQASKMVFVIRKRGRQTGDYLETKEVGSWATRGYWIPDEFFEINAWNCFEERFHKILRGKEESNKTIKRSDEAKVFADLGNGANLFIKKYNTLELDKIIPSSSVDYVFTDPPYGDAVPYLELDYMWSSWLKFKPNFDDEIIISDSPARDKTEELYERMLKVAFGQIYRVLKPGKYMTLTFHNTNIKVWNAIINACLYGGFDLEKIIYQSPARTSPKGLLAPYASAVGDYYIRFKRPEREREVSLEKIDEERYKRIVLESAKKIIAERGEPTPYTFVLNGIIIELKKEGALLTGKQNPDSIMKEFLDKEFILIDAKDEKGKVVGKKWWFKDPSIINYLDEVPLSDRLETAIVDVLRRKVKISFDDILQEIFTKFPNSLTPDAQGIKEILNEYADKTKDGNWMLKTNVKFRESAHNGIIFMIGEIGVKAGFEVLIGQKEQGELYEGKRLSDLCSSREPIFENILLEKEERVRQIDVIWYKNNKIFFEFEVENTTAITEAIVRGSNISDDTVKRFIAIPEEREGMLRKKLQEPILKENVEKNGWRFIFYKDLEYFYGESKKKRTIDIKSFEKISRDPQKPTSGQLKLL